MAFNPQLCNFTIANFQATPAFLVNGACPCGQPLHLHPAGNQAPDYNQILDDLERGAVEFLNSEKGPILACKVLGHFKNAKNMGEINAKDQKFVKKLIKDLKFRMHLGVSNDSFYMEATPETNEIGVNQNWLDAYHLVTDAWVKRRDEALLRVKTLYEILGHLLTRHFLKYLSPGTKEVNTAIKIGQWSDTMGETGLCVEKELLHGRLEHSYDLSKPWDPKKLMLQKVVKGKAQWFEIKDSAIYRLLSNPATSTLDQYAIKPKELVLLKTEVGKKRKNSAQFIFHQTEHPTKRLIFTGLEVSAIGNA